MFAIVVRALFQYTASNDICLNQLPFWHEIVQKWRKDIDNCVIDNCLQQILNCNFALQNNVDSHHMKFSFESHEFNLTIHYDFEVELTDFSFLCTTALIVYVIRLIRRGVSRGAFYRQARRLSAEAVCLQPATAKYAH